MIEVLPGGDGECRRIHRGLSGFRGGRDIASSVRLRRENGTVPFAGTIINYRRRNCKSGRVGVIDSRRIL